MTRLILSAISISCLFAGCQRQSESPPDSKDARARVPPAEAKPAGGDSKSPQQPSPSKSLVTQVPSLMGVSVDWAQQLLRLKQLKDSRGRLYLPDDQWDNDWTEGTVCLQTPQKGVKTKPGATVAFWTMHRLGADGAIVRSPDVSGKNLDAATIEIQQAGLAVMTVLRQPTAAEPQSPNKVLAQYPTGARGIGKGSTVLLHVASPVPSKESTAVATP